MNLEFETKIEIKCEDDGDDFGIVEVMLEDDEAEVSEGIDIFKRHSKRSRSPRVGEKRSYKRKKNLDEGLVVVEVDGEKIYQCEICKVRNRNEKFGSMLKLNDSSFRNFVKIDTNSRHIEKFTRQSVQFVATNVVACSKR